MYWITETTLDCFLKRSSIFNTTLVTACCASTNFINYSVAKGAAVSFTKSAFGSLAEKGIRVNAVAPYFLRMPLINASGFSIQKVVKHGSDVTIERAAERGKVAPAYLFLASFYGT